MIPSNAAVALKVCFIFSIVSNSRIISHHGAECRIIARFQCPGIDRRSFRKRRKTLQRFGGVRTAPFFVSVNSMAAPALISRFISLCVVLYSIVPGCYALKNLLATGCKAFRRCPGYRLRTSRPSCKPSNCLRR